MEKGEEKILGMPVAEVISSKGGKNDKVTITPARPVKNVPKPVLDFLGVTTEEPDIHWKYIEDAEGNRFVVLMKGRKK